MYVLQVHFHEEQSNLNVHIAEHTRWVNEAMQEKLFILAGQKTRVRGSIMLAVDMPKAQLDALINNDPFVKNKHNDPFVKNKLASYTISHFDPFFYQDELSNFISG